LADTAAFIEENQMSKHLGNMKRLCTKLQVRYGADDELVLQVKRELDLLASTEANHARWSTPYREFVKGGANTTASPARGHPRGGGMNSP
jgi:hypothetical protein